MRQRPSFEIILVGKSILLKEGLTRLLREADIRIVASVTRAGDSLPSKIRLHRPLFIVVNTGEDSGTAVEYAEVLRNQHSSSRIAIVSDHCRMDELVSAFRAGVNGYFIDAMTSDVFIKSIELVMMGATIFPPAFSTFALGHSGDLPDRAAPRETRATILIGTDNTSVPQLSAREKSILRCLIEGDSNKRIARKINIAEATVKVHVKAILRKIRVENRTQAAIWGINNGSVTGPASNSTANGAQIP